LIGVYDTPSGRLIRTLGKALDPDPMSRFTVTRDESTLYYVHQDEPRQIVEMVAQPISGAPGHVLGAGTVPTPNPDNTQLAYLPYRVEGEVDVRSLTDGTVHKYHLPTLPPPASTEWIIKGMTWTDQTHLVVGLKALPIHPDCPLGVSCPSLPESSLVGHALLLNTANPQAGFTDLPALKSTYTDWYEATLLGAKPEGNLLVLAYPVANRGTGTPHVISVNPATGDVTTVGILPTDASWVSTDPAGQHFLVGRQPNQNLYVWTPTTGQITPTKIPATEAAW
jgi:hypothetical protein